jgi:hypothetical protein
VIALFLLAQANVDNVQRRPDMEAASNYAQCVGKTAVVASASTPAVDEAVKKGFDKCAASREVAKTAIAAALLGKGLDATRASETAEEILAENDKSMAFRLKADIDAHRETGQTSPHAQN